MASDLSKFIEESLTSTLTGLLAKEATLEQITQAHPKDIEEQQLLQVQSRFDFLNFTSLFSFMLPARTSSLIFNTMMTAPIHELSLIIDDDTEDAIGEFISNVSGGLTTYINSAQLEDLGQTKFNISHKERLQGEDVIDLDNTYRFQIDLEGNEVVIFITFDEVMLPYIMELTGAPITLHEEPEIKEEEKEPEPEIETVEPIKEVSLQKKETKQEEEDPNAKKIKMAIIGVSSLLGIVFLMFLVLYFMGFFDAQEEIPIKEEEQTLQQDPSQVAVEAEVEKNAVQVVQYTTLQKVDFKVSDIDINRLNTQLAELTKYKVLNKEELEAQELAEKNRLFELEREKELLAFSKQNNEEAIFEKQNKELSVDIDKKTKFLPEESTQEEQAKQTIAAEEIIEEDPIDPSQLQYATTNSLRYNLFKTLVLQVDTQSARISICNDQNGRTTIYIGPFETTALQNTFIEKVALNNKTISMNAANITQEEFNLRCNIE